MGAHVDAREGIYVPKRMKTILFFRKPYEKGVRTEDGRDVRIGSKGGCHGARDDFFIFFQVCDGSKGKAPVRNLMECQSQSTVRKSSCQLTGPQK